jgi:hypothetical protein
LPYKNDAKDKLTYIQFDLSEKNITDKEYIEINNFDNTLSTYIDISLKNTTTNTISLEIYDNFLTKTNLTSNINTITIVNITNNKYDKINSSDSEGSLGIIPIIVSPANALYYQNLLSNITNTNF